jgi:hypothetical protein
LREQLCPDLDEDAAAVGEQFWQELETGHIPESLPGSSPKQTRHE